MTDLPETRAIEWELTEGWLTLWFNQPESRNALSEELTNDLRRILGAVKDDRAVRGLTLRGRGGVFCAGGDLKSFRQMTGAGVTRAEIEVMSARGGDLFQQLNEMPQVTIALIEGAAMAGGFGMACCCDVVICEAGAKFAMTETMIGLSPAQIAPFVVQKLGFATARRLMLTAARFEGKEAAELGFADAVGTGAGELEAIEARLKAQILNCAPGAIADTKALILALPGMAREDVVKAAAANFAGRMLSAEGQEGIASFLEARKPAWAKGEGEGEA